MNADMRERCETLERLLTDPGWLLFTAHATQEWGAAGLQYQRALDQALDVTDPAVAASQARQIRAARRMVEVLIAWPAEEVARLKRLHEGPATTDAGMPRGGYA